MRNTFESYTALVEMIGEESALKLIKSVDGGTIMKRSNKKSLTARNERLKLPK